jgi:hypothetical protein
MIVWDLHFSRYLIALKSAFDNEANWDEYEYTWGGSPPPQRRVETLFGTELKFSFAEISGLFSGKVDITPLSAEGFSLHPVKEVDGKLAVHTITDTEHNITESS